MNWKVGEPLPLKMPARSCLLCRKWYDPNVFSSCPHCMEEESIRNIERINESNEEPALAINAIITANGRSCRECQSCNQPTVIAPTCSKFTQVIRSRILDTPAAEIPIFCHQARDLAGLGAAQAWVCGPTALFFEQREEKPSVFLGSKD